MILFVCSQGRLRSRTAELLCLFGGLSARSCGTAPDAETPVTDVVLRQASLVVCMEGAHKKALAAFSHYGACPVVTLGIPDAFNRLDPLLARSLIYQMSFHDQAVADAMSRGAVLLGTQSGYTEALGTSSPTYADSGLSGSLLASR